MRIKETKVTFTNENNMYTKEREALHQKIMATLIKQSKMDSFQPPVAILVGGGSASGKTSLCQTIVKQNLKKKKRKLITIDPDEIKKLIPEYQAFQKTFPSSAATLVHKESVDISEKLVNRMIESERSFLLEGTMAKTGKYVSLVNRLLNRRYEVNVYIVDVPVHVAIEREAIRARKTGRSIPRYVINRTHRYIPKTFLAIKDEVSFFEGYDNQYGLKLFISNHFIDETRYKEFLRKSSIKVE
ncbi:zeta toxin family protein [Fictibacillus norfolkensis]|uniref:UDP-N-acetylglucosamine kinase n=1 Tax=Fictibacillus norfolkensis TaxID=2762233 RepID=A0ABR8SPY5_9BACL|nr:zeta toxin family protein [Fictibacillus norfolkensis]MBD7965443.1 zeta toxin family protein [Fictibacillus norfolkensis]